MAQTLDKHAIQRLLFLKHSKRFFVTSDTHFYHEKILKRVPNRNAFKNRGFSSHDEWLIAEWNSVVKEGDLVLHLGDIADSSIDSKLLKETVKKLNGIKYLVLGNKDGKDLTEYESMFEVAIGKGTVYVEEENGFCKINTGHVKANGLVINLNGITILFSHYPVFVLPRWETNATKILREIFIKFSCDINIHGHTHDVVLKDKRLINVSLDVTNYRPVLLNFFKNKYPYKNELF